MSKKDVVHQFMEKIATREFEFVVTSRAFNAMCGTAMEKNRFIAVRPITYWAFGELQLVWRDVLEKLSNKAYVAATVQELNLEKTMAHQFVCTFVFKDTRFFADKVADAWTICLLEER